MCVFFRSDGGLSLCVCELFPGNSLTVLLHFTSLLEYLIKAIQKLCVCVLPSASVSVEILSCRVEKVQEFTVSSPY